MLFESVFVLDRGSTLAVPAKMKVQTRKRKPKRMVIFFPLLFLVNQSWGRRRISEMRRQGDVSRSKKGAPFLLSFFWAPKIMPPPPFVFDE
jgi:hypothetical protein